MSPPEPPPPDWDPADGIAAATVVLVRDAPDRAVGIEVLMLRRNAQLAFAGGLWVFPGGRVDDDDRAAAAGAAEPDLAAARNAACREAGEEAGLALDPAALVPLSHWTPPGANPAGHRFLTWFFVAAAPDAPVTVDDGEIHEHGWFQPLDAIARRDREEIELAPPTWITLHHLAGHTDTASLLAHVGRRGPECFKTRFAAHGGGLVAVYHGDVAYDALGPDGEAGAADPDLDRPGPRHRLTMSRDRWHYDRTAD